MVRRHGTSLGAASRTGTPALSPAFTSSRNTVLAASVSASPRGVKMRRVWVVTIRLPVLPWRSWMSENSISRRELVAHPDVAVEGEGRAGIHAPRHRDLGQHAAGEGRAVLPELRRAGMGMQVQQMPARRDRLAFARHLVRPVEGRDHRLDRRLGDDVLVLDLAAELLLERFDVDGHGASPRICRSVTNPAMIRAARPHEIALLPQIENAADERYARQPGAGQPRIVLRETRQAPTAA